MTGSLQIPDRIFLVGAGAAGAAIGRALTASGHSVEAIASRSGSTAEALATEIGARQAGERFEHLADAELIIIAVPDAAVRSVASGLASERKDWSSCVVCHLSGALSSAALDEFRHGGARAASFHPMVAILPDAPASVFYGVRFNVEGDERAVRVCSQIARAIGAEPHEVGRDTKLLIHLAATIVSNYFVTLASVAVELLERGGVAPGEYESLLRPLAAATLSNVRFESPSEALTGPVARADTETVVAHLELLRERFPEFLPLIASLVAETVNMASGNKRLSPEESEALLAVVSKIMQTSRR